MNKVKFDSLGSTCFWKYEHSKITTFLEMLVKLLESTGTEMHSLTGMYRFNMAIRIQKKPSTTWNFSLAQVGL